MIKKSTMHYAILIISLLLAACCGVLSSQAHALSFFRGPTPSPTRITSGAIPAEAVLQKRLEYIHLIPLSNTYRLATIWQNDFCWNANALEAPFLTGEIVLSLFPWLNFFTSYQYDHYIGLLTQKPEDNTGTAAQKSPTTFPERFRVDHANLILGDLAVLPVYIQVGVIHLPFGLHAKKVFSKRLTYINQLCEKQNILGGGIGWAVQNGSLMGLLGYDHKYGLERGLESLIYGILGQYRGYYKRLAFNIGGAFYSSKNWLRKADEPYLNEAYNLYFNVVQGAWELFMEYGTCTHETTKETDENMFYLQHKINFEQFGQKCAFYYGLEKGSIFAKPEGAIFIKKAPIAQFFMVAKMQYNQVFSGLAGLKYNCFEPIGFFDKERFEWMLQLQLSF